MSLSRAREVFYERPVDIIAKKFAVALLVTFLVLSLAMIIDGKQANAYPSRSPDGIKCTPCHTDGRTGKKVTQTKATTTTKTTTMKAVKSKQPAPAETKISIAFEVPGKKTINLNAYGVKDEVLVPVRIIAEALNARVTNWDSAKKAVEIAHYSGTHFSLPAGKIVGNTAYVSAKDLADKLGADFDGKTFSMKGKEASVMAQWAKGNPHDISSWGVITTDSPVNRDTCIACHDGQGFANEKTKRADLPEESRNKPNSIDCSACHSDRGRQISTSGKTPVLANGYQVLSAGRGALCITCHNGRRTPVASPKPDSNPAPHRGMQADILFGFGGYSFGLDFPTSPHGANPDTCVGCHMASRGTAKNHTFKIENATAACGSCHPGLKTINRPALGDYDGDKVIEGIQDEVRGLIALLEKAIEEAVPTGHMHESHGQVYFVDKTDETKTVNVAPEIYWAAWNLIAVENDGSYGIHNPAYVVSLLQKTYKQVTGKNVPNATLR